MANILANVCKNTLQGNAPYSDSYVESFQLIVDSSGYFTASDTPATAVQIGDVVRLGVIPAGTELHSALLAVGDAFSASTTCKVGFAYADGVDSTAVPQDDDYFFAAGTATSSAAVLPSSNAAVSRVTLPKPAYLILTNAGAAYAAAGRLDVTVFGKMRGVKGNAL
jgi:hypothetical protein